MNRHASHGASAVNPSMGSAAASAAATAAARTRHWVVRTAKNAIRTISVYWRERIAVKTLSSLDDRTLKDIGISRSEIPYLANRHANTNGIDYRDLLGGR